MHVVVVGGGIVGLSCAYALADRGAAVTVCESGTLGGGSTARSAGGIRTQFSTRVNVELSLSSLPVWESFEERFGVDIAYNRTGYLFLARESDTADAFGEQVAMQNDCGAESELLSPAEVAERWPHVRHERFVAATYSPLDGFADPYLALQGYATAAREAGVDIQTKTPVESVERVGSGSGGRFRVETGGESDEGGAETLDADYVVNAAGAWAGEVAAMVGLDLPISPRRRQIAVVEPETPVADAEPLTIDLDTGSYFRPEREGRALVGGQFDEDDPDADPDRFSESMDLDWAVTAVERAGDCADYFGPETRIVRGWAGLYAVTPDHHPIVEESAPGVITAAGFSGHGFQHAPATGRVVAELCLDGEASHVDVSALESDRFERGGGLAERNVA
ncbi:FAD-binding oxidoreductase [Haloprofundus sp. MHR1]|uniref:NAD(P)/FAD-dependent oxidoreductase n=1 Tax=Haloprofundus sp. MHR1 TaxID=2572921 RepID=UPI0010BE53D7|nr:FAD-dependent oxidoreductase [Haloprofundus sp. MHR1]QCJ46734.1 FAD-binding oxidoreductase [Haloprofundus sp. MHR1]